MPKGTCVFVNGCPVSLPVSAETRFASEHDATPLDYLEQRLGEMVYARLWMPKDGEIRIFAEAL